MNLHELISEHIGGTSIAEVSRRVNRALGVHDPDDSVTKETVRLWVRGLANPATEARAAALAEALDVSVVDMWAAMGWKPPGADIHQRVDHIEHLLRKADIWEDPAPDATVADEVRRRLPPVEGIHAIKDGT